MSIREVSKLSLFAVLALVVCGCGRPNIIGTDAAVYSRGKLYAVFSQDLNSVYSATLAAMEQLGLEVAKKEIDVFYAKVVGNIADGRTVTIRMEPGAENATNLRIKTGSFGNEERSRVIYEKIQENLSGVRK